MTFHGIPPLWTPSLSTTRLTYQLTLLCANAGGNCCSSCSRRHLPRHRKKRRGNEVAVIKLAQETKQHAHPARKPRRAKGEIHPARSNILRRWNSPSATGPVCLDVISAKWTRWFPTTSANSVPAWKLCGRQRSIEERPSQPKFASRLAVLQGTSTRHERLARVSSWHLEGAEDLSSTTSCQTKRRILCKVSLFHW